MSWYVASTVNNIPDDHYIYINNDTVSRTISQSELSGYNTIDYILVGGGGGGGGGADGSGVSNYGGGGGGSGYITSSFSLSNITNNGFTYNIPNTGATSYSLVNATSVEIVIGSGGIGGSGCNLTDPGNCATGDTGGTTLISINYSSGTPIGNNALGGNGGQGGGYTCGGLGGNGYNGGGGGGGGSCSSSANIGGSGDTLNGGINGGNGSGDSGGNGGGLGGGEGGSGTSQQDGDNTGGGGGGGSGITNLSTGGQGAESFREDTNRGSTAGTNYTGGGGGGGTCNVGSGYEDASSGGSGYAIIRLRYV